MEKETYYFSHDYNTRTDPKIKRLLAKHGMQGYGIFWAIVEDLYNNANAVQTDYETIAYDLRVTPPLVESIINDFDLFVLEDGFFGSLSVQKRLDIRNEISQKARASANARWAKEKGNNATAMRTHTDRNAIKGKDIKEKDKKEKQSKFEPPTEKDVINYFLENNYSSEAAKRAYKYYEAAKWHDSKSNAVKNWKQKMIAVWFKPENKKEAEPFIPKYKNLHDDPTYNLALKQ
jgi:hypothetical protein